MEQRDPEQVPRDAQREPQRPGACATRGGRPSGSGTTRVAVAAAADEEDQLDVEHDARDLLAGEQVAGDVAAEALEAALRVLDRADDPQRRERWKVLPSSRRHAGCDVRMSEPSGWIREP